LSRFCSHITFNFRLLNSYNLLIYMFPLSTVHIILPFDQKNDAQHFTVPFFTITHADQQKHEKGFIIKQHNKNIFSSLVFLDVDDP